MVNFFIFKIFILPTLLSIIGVVCLFIKKISITKNSEVRRPRTIFLGLIMLINALVVIPLLRDISGFDEDANTMSMILTGAGFVVPVVLALLLKQEKLEEVQIAVETVAPSQVA